MPFGRNLLILMTMLLLSAGVRHAFHWYILFMQFFIYCIYLSFVCHLLTFETLILLLSILIFLMFWMFYLSSVFQPFITPKLSSISFTQLNHHLFIGLVWLFSGWEGGCWFRGHKRRWGWNWSERKGRTAWASWTDGCKGECLGRTLKISFSSHKKAALLSAHNLVRFSFIRVRRVNTAKLVKEENQEKRFVHSLACS